MLYYQYKGGDPMTVGERIKARRKELGLSADDLAAQIGVNRTSMFRYEKGTIEKMPVSAIIPIAKALHVDPVWLLTGHSDAAPPEPQRPELQELLALAESSTPDEVQQMIRVFRAMKGE